MQSLEQRVVIVTGASSGIGRAAALRFAREKSRLVLAARRRDRLEELAAEIAKLGAESMAVPTDVSDEDQVKQLVEATLQRFRRIDVLVNNAGHGLFASIQDTTSDELASIFATNFAGAFYGVQAVLPVMQRQGRGSIINVSSIAGKRALPLSGAYCASKFALNALTESLRAELRGSGITVSLVLPVATGTQFFSRAKNKSQRPSRPLGIVQSAEAVAETILACARRPRAEVLPYWPARLLIVLNAISPGVVDWLGHQWLGRFLQHPSSQGPVHGTRDNQAGSPQKPS